MKIYLPHLDYTILTKSFKRHTGVPNARAYARRIDASTVHLFLPKKNMPGDLAHEVVHVLQYICNDRDMDFVQEQEHMGYLMHYILGRLMCHEWVPKK